MKRLVLISIVLIQAIALNAQNNISLKGLIIDSSDNKAIYSASVLITGTHNGTTTGKTGLFNIKGVKYPITLEVSHLSYQTQILTIHKPCDTLKIRLVQKSSELPALSIKVRRPEAITKDKPLFIWDYAFQGKDILLLAFKHKNVLQPTLLVVNKNGDSIFSSDIKQAQNLVTDGLYNNHLLTKSLAFQIYYDSTELRLLYPNSIEDFHKKIDPFVTACNHHFFFKQYYYNKQLLVYTDYNQAKDSSSELASIEDAKGKRMFRDFPRMIRSKNFTEADLRFETEIMYKPVYAPLFVIRDTIYIFNHTNEEINIYDNQGKSIKDIAINYQNENGWAKQLIVDQTTKEVYAVFKNKNIISLAQINLKTGKLLDKTTIPDLAFIENIKINDGDVYFLYKEKTDYEFKRLYKMRL